MGAYKGSYAIPCQDPEVDKLIWSDNRQDQEKAAEICRECPLREMCEEMGRTEEYGVWGGKTQWDRPNAARLAKQADKERKAAQLRERDARIVRLGRIGYSRSEIAHDFDLAEVTVKGILAKESRAKKATGPKMPDPAERARRDAHIITMRSHGKRVVEIAEEFGLAERTIYDILRSA